MKTMTWLIKRELWEHKGMLVWAPAVVATLIGVLALFAAFFDDVFSVAAGASTRAALLALWKRPATRLEKLFAEPSIFDE